MAIRLSGLPAECHSLKMKIRQESRSASPVCSGEQAGNFVLFASLSVGNRPEIKENKVTIKLK